MVGNDGGVSVILIVINILFILDGEVFKMVEFGVGYNLGGMILNGNFMMWRDVVVFFNNGGCVNDFVIIGMVDRQCQYFIVVLGCGKVGYILGDGIVFFSDVIVYWFGVVKENFVLNVICEVNLILCIGGSMIVFVIFMEYGGLIIIVGVFIFWDSNIVNLDIIM